MAIQVTQQDIDRGKRGDDCWCPVALAINRWSGRNSSVDVDTVVIGIDTADGKPDEFLTPPKIAEFIRRFDNGEPVEPFEFDL
jgi:hypothetical protein